MNPARVTSKGRWYNKLAITVFDDYADIVDRCCDAWTFFANDPAAVASITSRSWAQVSL